MVERLGKLEVYDVENPDIDSEKSGVQTYDIEKPSTPSKWERVKGAVKAKYQDYKTERAVVRKVRQDARREARYDRAAQKFQARVDTARGRTSPQQSMFGGIHVNRPAMSQMKSSFGNFGGFGMQPKATSQSYRTKTVYKKVGKHYRKLTRRIPIKATSMSQPQQSSFFGGLNGSEGQQKQNDMSFGLGHLARGMNGTKQTKGKKKSNGSSPFNFRIGF